MKIAVVTTFNWVVTCKKGEIIVQAGRGCCIAPLHFVVFSSVFHPKISGKLFTSIAEEVKGFFHYAMIYHG